MKEKNTDIDSNKITGFFDKNTEIEGTLKFSGSFQIDGHFKGKIDSNSVLIIGENGKVESDINIGILIVNGEIKGNIHAKERVEINPRGQVVGTITTPSLIVKDGANLEAQCHTIDKNVSPKPKSPKKETKKEDSDIQEGFLS